jgi:glycosyltransferase involved in cell wall biosynthesis
VKILWVKAGRLLPVDTGGKIRSFNLLKQLAARHDTTLLSYYAGARDNAYDDALESELPGRVALPVGGPASYAGTVADYLRRLTSKAPYAVTKFTSDAARTLIGSWMREKRFDVMICDFLSASLTFPARLSTPTALFQHNVESALWDRQARHEPNPFKRVAFSLEAAKMARYERAAVQRFHHVIAVSENDRALMSSMVDPSRISVAPTGVDLAQYRAIAGEQSTEPVVMFLGSMDWEANVDGVTYFHREIWPRVRAVVPAATFRIVGRSPAPRVKKLAEDPSVVVTGAVSSVVDHLRDAAVFVVPLRIGGGTRLKIYEAMAAGRACVSTIIGAEGLDVNHDRDIVLADEPGDFADAVSSLLLDLHRRRALEQAAAAQAAQFDWPVVVRQFEDSLEQTIVAASAQRESAGTSAR